MRFVFPLLPAVLLLAGCPAPKAPETPQPTPSATPVVPVATPTPIPAPAEPVKDFVGCWTGMDAQGQAFDVTIFGNGQAITNWTKSKGGAQGQRGTWQEKDGTVQIIYEDGWRHAITQPSPGALHLRTFAPGGAPDAAPASDSSLQRIGKQKAGYIGIWRLNPEPDGTYQFLVLQSSGRAYSTVNGGTEGSWKITVKGAECTWPDGWIDSIEPVAKGWQKRSWLGTDPGTETDLSPAERVDETPLKPTL